MANSIEKTEELIQRYQAATGKTLVDITQQAAKIAAEWIAVNATAPIGKSLASKRVGENAVARDVQKIIKTPGWLYKEVLANQGKGKAGQYWNAYKDRNLELMREFLPPGAVFTDSIKPIHQVARVRGKVPKYAKPLAIAESETVGKYIKTAVAHVGRAKGGWADAAKALGNARFPAWFKTGEGGATTSTSTGGVKVDINSNVPYASDLIDSEYKQKALRIGYDRVLKMMKAALKKNGN
jgi:hypothetical protein